MNRLFSKYYICEEGHITIGDTEKSKCEASDYHLEYNKGKKKKTDPLVVKATKKCGKKIIATKDLPEKMNLAEVWEHEVMHAFLIGQKLDAEFMIDLQKEISSIWEKLNAKK